MNVLITRHVLQLKLSNCLAYATHGWKPTIRSHTQIDFITSWNVLAWQRRYLCFCQGSRSLLSLVIYHLFIYPYMSIEVRRFVRDIRYGIAGGRDKRPATS